MNSQILRIMIAGALAIVSLLGVIALAALHDAVPQLVEIIATGSLFYLFGVVTNGSGLGGSKPGGGAT